MTAALVLAHLVGPKAIRNGEIYSAAMEREQAAIVFKIRGPDGARRSQTAGEIHADLSLGRRCHTVLLRPRRTRLPT
jgi:hypothetical protein